MIKIDSTYPRSKDMSAKDYLVAVANVPSRSFTEVTGADQ